MNRIYINAPVTIGFAAVSFVVLLLGQVTGDFTTGLFFSVYQSPLGDPAGYVRLFGHVLGHADFQHYFGNISILLLIGPMLEEKYGSKALGISIAVTALFTGLLQILLFPREALLGASGIVFMMILMSSYANFKKGQIPLSLILIAVLYLGKEVADSMTQSDNISQFTHVAGGLAGAVLGYALNLRRMG